VELLRGTLLERDDSYRDLVAHNQDLIVKLVEKQSSIIDNRLGLDSSPVNQGRSPNSSGNSNNSSSSADNQVSLKRPSWSQIRGSYEAKMREQFWRDKIAAVEQADSARAESLRAESPMGNAETSQEAEKK
jgi:hypothetical protein